MKPKNRIAIAFGSYGWAGGAVKEIAEMLTSFGVEVVDKVDVKFKPNKDEVQKCYDIAVSFAQKLK
jgi:flavorubredoxin